jgi:hypothetical protein
MEGTLLTRLQNWYISNCDGDWEHNYGISIETLDNPGWTIKIELTNTNLEDLHYEKRVDNGDLDWFFIKVKDKVFEASGDPNKLKTILTIFLEEIVPKFSEPQFK